MRTQMSLILVLSWISVAVVHAAQPQALANDVSVRVFKRRSHMSKSPTILLLFAALGAAGCMSQAQYLASKQPTAIQSAVSRGQFEMNCPSATGQVLSQEVTQPVSRDR